MRLYEFNYFSCRYFVRNKSLVFSSPLTLAWKSYNLKQNISDTQKLMSKIPTLPIKLKGPRTYLARVSKEVKFHFRSMASSF